MMNGPIGMPRRFALSREVVIWEIIIYEVSLIPTALSLTPRTGPCWTCFLIFTEPGSRVLQVCVYLSPLCSSAYAGRYERVGVMEGERSNAGLGFRPRFRRV